MNKPEFIKEVAKNAEGTQVEARKYVDAFEQTVAEALKRGEDVKLMGFINFESKDVEASVGRNPKTGEAVDVPAHRKAKATLAKGLRKF